jgi:hypothetical protein
MKLFAEACLVIAFNACATAAAATSYLCIGEQATGFGMNEKSRSWTVQRFQPRKYVIKAPVKGPTAPGAANTSVFAETNSYPLIVPIVSRPRAPS